jgi:hypothetical protein
LHGKAPGVAALDSAQHPDVGIEGVAAAEGIGLAQKVVVDQRNNDRKLLVVAVVAQALVDEAVDRKVVAATQVLGGQVRGQRGGIREVVEPQIGVVAGPLQVEAPAPGVIDRETPERVDMAAKFVALRLAVCLFAVRDGGAAAESGDAFGEEFAVFAGQNDALLGGDYRLEG